MRNEVIDSLKKIVGDDWVVSEKDSIGSYLLDATEEAVRPIPSNDCVVVKPANPEEISEILKYANREKVIVVARGGGTGCVGAVVPTQPSIILSLERFNKILEVDEKNLMIHCEAGVTLSDLVETFNKNDSLFFPVHPGDEGAQVGGMVAQNAGGARAVRHGVMRNHIKGLEIVLPTGEIINTGGKLLKNNTGYDLMHLMIGSEGTLGIVTKVILKLYPKSTNSGTLIVSFDKREDAVASVLQILQKGITPLAIEYFERDMALESAEHIGLSWAAKKGSVDLIFMLSEPKQEDLYANSEAIVELCEKNNAVDSLIAETTKEQRSILEVRSNAYTAIQHRIVDVLDVAVPLGKLPVFMNEVFALANKYNTKIPSLGHVGDGNIHNFILKEDGEIPSYYEKLKEELFKLAIECDGTITAEHGVGKIRNKNLDLQFTTKELDLMREIKKLFDPNNILNPGTGICY